MRRFFVDFEICRCYKFLAMFHVRTIKIGLVALLLFPAFAGGQSTKLKLPTMPGMRSTRKKPLAKALEQSKLCDFAKMGMEMASFMHEESGGDYKVYKTSKSVREVMEYYIKVAEKNGMPDASPAMWDNSDGKKDENQPKDASGTLVFSLNLVNEQISVTIAAYRAQRDRTTTVYIFLPVTEKRK